MRQALIIITTLLILGSCQTNSSSHNGTFQLLLPDTSKTHRPNTLFDHLKTCGRQMGLPRIDTGVNEFELRIWTGSMIDPDQMVLLRKSDTGTIAQKFAYNLSFDRLEHYELIKAYRSDTLTQYVDSLKNVDFKSIISQNEIANFRDDIADGITYHLEVATPTFYKLITYHCPERFAKTEINNKRFLALIFSIDRHVHFYSPICSF